MKTKHLKERIFKCGFECFVVAACIALHFVTHNAFVTGAEIVLLMFLCVTLSVNIINVMRHKVHLDKDTVRRECIAAEVAIIGLISLMMISSVTNVVFGFHMEVTPSITDIILYSVLALRDGIYIYLTVRDEKSEKKN